MEKPSDERVSRYDEEHREKSEREQDRAAQRLST